MDSTAARDEAEALIQDGYRVWAISRATRTPIRAGFARSNGPDVCASLEEFTDATEIGVLCGPCPAAGPGARYVCVDYDGPVPVDARISGAPTLTSKAGAHAWYRVPPGVVGFRQSQGVRRGSGPDGAWAVDTRDYGGYARETTNGEPLWDDGVPSHPRDITQAEVDALFGAPATAPVSPAPPRPASTTRTEPAPAWVDSFVARVVRNPDHTNECYAACASALVECGWTNDEIAAALRAWTPGHPQLPGRHLASALKAADTRRAGGRVPGFPRLAELGIPWVVNRGPGGPDITAIILEAQAEAGAKAEADTPPARARLGSAEPPFHWVTADEMLDYTLPDVQWLVEALSFAPGAPGLCTGYSGTGKTTTLQDLALSVATPGRKFLNYFPVRHGSVAHIDLEQGTQQTLRTYRALGLERGAGLVCSVLPSWRLTDRESVEELAKAAVGRTLVIIDSFRVACLGVDENSSDFAEPLGILGQISEATGCAFMLNHHSGKNNENRMKSARGTSAITAACSVHWSFEREDLAPTTRPCLQLVKSRNHQTDAMVWETYVEKLPGSMPGAFELHARADAGAPAGGDAADLAIIQAVSEQDYSSIKALIAAAGVGTKAGHQAIKRALRTGTVVHQNGIYVKG